MPVGTRRLLHRPRAQAGFTVIEMAIVVILVGLVIVPLLRLTASSVGATREQQTQTTLETARDALIAHAATNGGCLPFAADFEGGLIDTDASGAAAVGYVDTGVAQSPNHGRDLPWADLGLTSSVFDGDGLRSQYYVAKGYADVGVSCAAGFRGFEWNPSVEYNGSALNPLYVYYTGAGPSRALYKVIAPLPGGTSPDDPAVLGTITEDVTDPFPPSFLEVRRGPDVVAASPQNDPISLQNVFVLIAPGKNRNASAGRSYVRDSNHVADSAGTQWALDTPLVDSVIFSATPNVDSTDSGNGGDDTLLWMSFTNYKAMVSKYGLNMEPLCDGPC